MQLDIFEHGRDVMLRNDVVLALLRRDAMAARAACEGLAEAFPNDHYLPDLQTLAAVVAPVADQPIDDHDALCLACRRLDETIVPAARRALGDADGLRWVLPYWQNLARRSGRLPFRARGAACRALWLRAGEWEAAAEAVATIASWRRIPLPLSWMAEARLHLRGLQST